MKIVHVATREVSVEKLLKDKLSLLRDGGYEVYAVASGKHYVNDIAAEGVRYKHIPMSYMINPFIDILSVFLMTRYFRKERFDIVHTHTAKAGIIGRVSARLAGVPIVLHSYHGIHFYEGQNELLKYFYSRIEKLVGRMTDMVFSQNKGDIDKLVFGKVLPRQKVLYEGNGVNIKKLDKLRNDADIHELKRQLSINEAVPVIGCFARFEAIKGHVFFFKSLKRLLRVYPDAVCLVAGDGPLKKNLESLAFNLGIHRNLRFLGWREDIQCLHSVIDILVLSSQKEGIPRAVMEAMAAKKPVVATDVPGTKEIVIHQHTGILVPYGNEEALCDAISEIVKDKEKAARYGENGKARIEQEFDERMVVKRILKAYTDLTKPPKKKVKEIKIAHITTLDMSIRFLLLNQLLRLKARGYGIKAICGPGKWIPEIESYGIKVHAVKMQRTISPFRDLLALWKLFKYLKREGFNAVNTHTPKAGILGPVAAKLAGVPIVIHTVHGFLFHDKAPLLKRLFFMVGEKFTATFADYLFSQSREDMDSALKYKICRRDRLFYLGNGIDINRFNRANLAVPPERKRKEIGLGPNDLVVGIIARFVYEKGYLEYFRAAAYLAKRFDNVKFLAVGPLEPDRKDAVDQKIIRKLGITDKTIFLGMRRDIPELCSVMDVFVLPSYREGIPRTLMEASAMEVPVVATDIRGCREVVSDGETGLLVPVRDHRALAGAVAALLEDERKRVRMGKAGQRRIAGNFSDELVYERIEGLYDRLIKNAL